VDRQEKENKASPCQACRGPFFLLFPMQPRRLGAFWVGPYGLSEPDPADVAKSVTERLGKA
jgi:hypothetical protein